MDIKKIVVCVTVLLLMFCFLPIHTFAGDFPLIIDHNCTNISMIPTQWILQAKSNFHIAYGHTSHGSQLVSGMKVPADQNSLYAFSPYGKHGSLRFHDYAFSGDLGHNRKL